MELISNALVHRGLDRWSEGMTAEVWLDDSRLVVTNPGGLYGITVEPYSSTCPQKPNNVITTM